MTRIKQLSSDLANKIAAGEVVARPASVVKECMENSIDANSKAIVLDVEQGGIQLIRITDNGDGIVEEDLPLALAAHATSKINSADDLLNIHSLGFRGEALASIAAVSHFSLASKPKEQQQGWQVQRKEDSHELEITPAPQPEGTTVTVRDLFYNVPARRKFLRTPKTELQHIIAVVKSLALSYFYVGFTVQQQKKALFHWPAVIKGEEDKRIQQVVGASFLEHALKVDFHGEDMRLWGWLSTPQAHRSHSDCQYVFVNGRMVKDPTVAHGIRQAYGHDLPEGRYGAYVLYLELPPSEVDVNVHPTKREVRFQHSRLVHDFVVTSLQSAFTMDAQEKENDDDLWNIEVTPKIIPEAVESAIVTPQKDFSFQKETATPYEVIYGTGLSVMVSEEVTDSEEVTTITTVATEPVTLSESIVAEKTWPHSLGVFETHYGLLMWDQQLYALHIPRSVAQYYKGECQKGMPTKPLLMPVALTFEPQKVVDMELCYEQWLTYGLDCHSLSEDTVMVRGLPMLDMPWQGVPNKVVLEQCLETLVSHQNNSHGIEEAIGALLGQCVACEKVMEQKKCLQKLVEINKGDSAVMRLVSFSQLFT